MKKKLKFFVSAAVCVFSLTCFAKIPEWAKEFEKIAQKGSPREADWEKRADAPSKVFVYFDENGNPEIYVIGTAPIYTTMIADTALRIAQKRAEVSAIGTFAIWMRQTFTVRNEGEHRVVAVVTGGGNENSEDRLMSKEKWDQFASATLRGMSPYWYKQTSNRYYAVWRWSLLESRFARIVEMLTKDGSVDSAVRQHDMKIKEIPGTFID